MADWYVLLLTLWLVSNTLLCTFRLEWWKESEFYPARLGKNFSLEVFWRACCCVYCTILFCHCKIL